jgi:HAD superfamily hydrolase (TIGR01549 family)
MYSMDTPTLPPGLLLDLDDTILTYDAISRPIWREACAVFAGRSGVETAVLNQVLDETRGWYWSDPVRNREGRLRLDEVRIEVTLLALQKLEIGDRALATEITTYFQEHRDAAIDFFPGAREALQEFRRRGLRLALVTNGMTTHQREKISRFDLEQYFDAICIEGEMGFGKPDPRAFARALEGLGLRPDEVWMVGDNLEWDISGAQSVGVYAVWNDYRQRGLRENAPAVPDRTIHALSELVE